MSKRETDEGGATQRGSGSDGDLFRSIEGSELDARVAEVPDVESVLTGLNDSQREAALALRGPVAIVAGAGTGKTTTITRRIACQVRSGAFEASQILAVTFTEKAAGAEAATRCIGRRGRRGPDLPLCRPVAALATLVLAHG